ncbi:hypothetical protein ACQ4PT_009202 [Festuca glaucescens]
MGAEGSGGAEHAAMDGDPGTAAEGVAADGDPSTAAEGVAALGEEIKFDQELMTMFEKHSETKFARLFIAYCDPSEPYKPITENYTDVHVQPNNKASQDDDGYLRNPIPENEHVGIDEENMYAEKEPIPLNVVLFSDKKKDKDYVCEDESEDESDDDNEDEAEVDEDEEVHEPNHAPNVEYDKEDPPMTVGSKYPNMHEFKLAIRQHVVKRDFEFNTEKSGPRRFTAYCKRKDEDDCPWRLHASTTNDMCTVVVKTNPFDHDCSSTKRKKKVTNATKHWICEKVKDWLIEDATLGADELRKKLKEHYKIKIHYKRGNPEDIATMLVVREPPKRKKKTTKTTESSIVLCDDGAPTRMCFPPRFAFVHLPGTGSNQLVPLSIESSMPNEQINVPVKVRAKKKKKEFQLTKMSRVQFDSPSMCTRSKKINASSPAMSTRSKRRLSL